MREKKMVRRRIGSRKGNPSFAMGHRFCGISDALFPNDPVKC